MYKQIGIFSLLLLLTTFAGPAKADTPDALMLRFPDVSKERIVFAFAGDIWVVSKDGGMARRISSASGLEMFPKFSPDGKTLAFTGNYDGNMDVYTMPVDGGSAKRLTYHSMPDLVIDWYPDGKNILFRSKMASPSYRFSQFYKQSADGGISEPLPLKIAELASFNSDGKKIAFQFISNEFRTWKRYRGGTASDIWIYDFEKNTSEQITDFDGTDAMPMWAGNIIYFVSDRDENQKLNIWAYDVTTKKFRQVTKFTEYDIKWPSLGPDAIVFENGGQLYLLNLADETLKPVNIQVPADLPKARTQLKGVADLIQTFSLSPSGKRALFEARGDIFTVPEKSGSMRNLTNTSGAAERFPVWSPDGKNIAYFSDKTGEYELYLRTADGKGDEQQITKDGNAFRYNPAWAPNSKKLVFSDKSGSLFLLDLANPTSKFVDKDEWTFIMQYSWSPDSRWLTYAKVMPNGLNAIFIYDTEQSKTTQVTSAYYSDMNPVFDPEGKYLYFYSNRNFNPVYSDMDATWIYPNSTNLFVATLRKDLASPLAPKTDEEAVKEDKPADKDKKQDTKSDAKDEKDKKDKGPEPVKIDFEGLEQRAVQIPVELGNVGGLAAVKGKVVYLKMPAAGSAKPDVPSGTLGYYDLEERESKTIINGINAFDVSADGKKIIYKSRNVYGIIDIAAGKNVGDGSIATGAMQAWVNPQQEWEQMFNEAWRVERDYFYDPNMHGVDWKAMKKRYAKLLPYIMDREDLNYVIGELIAELNVSHAYVGGGDLESVKMISVGLLGCDFELDKTVNAFRIKKIYEGAAWDTETRSPLRLPGINVQEGNYLLAVNGRPLDISKDPYASFQGLTGETVTLSISPTANSKDAKDIIVKPMGDEFRLRNLSWIEENRKKVEAASNGQIGYVYVPSTGIDGQNELVRQFTPQYNKKGLIVDERFNSGGQIPDRFIELLNRPIYNYWGRRDQRDWQTPGLSLPGPKAMLINQWAGSGGDAFPYYFRKAGLGPLIGKRTWGGLVGISGNPQLIDGGFISAPTFGFWNTKGQWDVENHGVDPDIDIENTPDQLAKGVDTQLNKAVETVLDAIKKQGPTEMKKPVYPNKSGK